MERKIGEVFELDGVKLRVEKSTSHGLCDGCFYDTFDSVSCHGRKCIPPERTDETDVIFTEVKE